MANITITVKGLEQTNSFLSELPDKIQRAIDEALSQLGDDILNVTNTLVPVDTGFLQSSISVEKTSDGLTAIAAADYASYVDEGTYKMSAQPFFKGPVNDLIQNFGRTIEAKLDSSGIFGY